jgi:hypothetical protein
VAGDDGRRRCCGKGVQCFLKLFLKCLKLALQFDLGRGKKNTEVGGADWGVGLGFDAALVGKNIEGKSGVVGSWRRMTSRQSKLALCCVCARRNQVNDEDLASFEGSRPRCQEVEKEEGQRKRRERPRLEVRVLFSF